MKKILVVLLGILMTFAFIACDTGNGAGGNGNNNSSSINGELSADDLEFDIEVSVLPEASGSDPFANVKKLYGESYNYEDYNEYYEVDSENKILTYYSRDTDENGSLDSFSPIYDFSYSYNGVENTFSFVVKNLINGDEIIPITNTSRVKEVFVEEINKEIEYGKKYYDEIKQNALKVFANGSDAEKEYIKIYVAVLCDQCGLDYSEDDITSENIVAILDKCYAMEVAEMIEKYTNSFPLMIDDLCSLNQYKIVTLESTTEEGIYVIEADGIYDESKKWYEQSRGYFQGYWDDNFIAIFVFESYVYIDNMDYVITEITDNKIICVDEEGKEKELTYTKTGSSENTIITVDCGDFEVQLTWHSEAFLD